MIQLAQWAVTLLLSLSLVLFTITIWRTIDMERKLKSIPGPKTTHGVKGLIMGHLADLFTNGMTQQISAWGSQYGDLYKLRFLNGWFIVSTNPSVYGPFLKHGPLRLPKEVSGYRGLEMFTHPHVPNIVSSPDDDYWKSIRKAVAPAFATSNMRLVFPYVQSSCQQLVDLLSQPEGQGQPVNMENLANRVTLDIIGWFLLDTDLGAVKGGSGKLLQAAKGCMVGAHDFFLDPWMGVLPWSKKMHHFKRATAEFDKTITPLVEDALRRSADASSFPQNCLLAHLLKWRDGETGKGLPLPRIKAEASILLMAGFETTASTIGWTLFLIAKHPEVEAKLVEELDSKGLLFRQSGSRSLTWEDLGDLPYLNACLYESMRILPVAADGTYRVVDRNITSGGVTLPKGSVVGVPIIDVHHNEAIWPNSWEYKPERWLKKGHQAAGAADGNGAAAGFIPFSDGPRNCVGQNLAMLELRVLLANLYSHFTFRLVEDTFPDVKSVLDHAESAITLKPKELNMYCMIRGEEA